ncbi:MAG: orotate phosphoribosyltransferase [FCB group bacterium]|nr:orotate phosphoribosyltransferase [FCB group bacterium]
MNENDLKQLLETSGALLKGHFLLTSGRHSDRYIEKFRILENPLALESVCKALAEQYSSDHVDLILGAAIGGILLAGGVGRFLKVNHIFTERVGGEMTLRRGFGIPKGSRVLIVEDIVTTGGSVFELIEVVKKHDAGIAGVSYLVDRNADPIDFGVNSKPLLKIPSLSWEPENCPLCAEGVPMTSRGRSGK